MSIPFHPIADLFPLIEGEDFRALVEDVRANGLHEEIILLDGRILDGRNRYRACLAAGVEPCFIDFAGDSAPRMFYGRDPLAWVLSKNLHRRHLNESQRAMVAARIARMDRGRPALYPKDSDDKPANLPDSGGGAGEGRDAADGGAQYFPPVKQADAAETLHVSERSVRTARKVIEAGAPELVEAVDRGDIAVSAAAELTSLPVEAQKEAIRNADPAALYAVIKEEKAKKQAAKKQRREDRELMLAVRQAALPEKRYGVIYADPEWRFEPYSRESGMDRAADNHYPTSDLISIKSRPVGDIAAEDCVLFLWATAPMLPQALEVMAHWGFAYKSHVIWRKAEVSPVASNPGKRDRGGYSGALMLGTGYWFRSGHELLLVGTRGKAVAPAMGDQFPSVIDHPALKHSEKPERFAEMIETYFPNLPKIELNARSARPGWDRWGYEAPVSEAPAGDTDPSRGEVSEAELTEYKILGAIDARIQVTGPMADELWLQGLFAGKGSDRPQLTEEGRERLKYLDAKVKAAASPDNPDAIRIRRDDNNKHESAPAHDGPPAGIATPVADAPEAASGNAASGSEGQDANTIIREGYAKNVPVAELARLTGLKPATVKKRAGRMGLGDPERQKQAARKHMTALHAARGGDQ